ncbi:MAG: hypothetical protein KBA28_07445 [Syntrophaceae bacterium]|jgi:hypothetical protein|nr:hypothetical protein [Syntrophaceae bacterium]
MGDTPAFSDNMQLSVSLPEIALVKVVLNGREWICQLSSRLSARLQEPGIYRVEAYLKSFGRFRPWLFSNPIFVI